MHEEAMIADLRPASSLIDDQCEAIELCRDGPRPLDPVKGRGPGPDPHGPAARGQAGLSIVGRKLHEDSVHGQERPDCDGALTVAGFFAGGTKIDTAEAVDVSYPGFFGQMAGLGARVSVG